MKSSLALFSVQLQKSAEESGFGDTLRGGYEGIRSGIESGVNRMDSAINNFDLQKFMREQAGLENFETPEPLRRFGGWVSGLSPNQKLGWGVGVPLAALALTRLLQNRKSKGDDKSASVGSPFAEDLIDTRKRTLPADMLYPWYANRAGRTRAGYEALGQEVPFRTKHPVTGSTVDALAGATAGAGLGALVGLTGSAIAGGGNSEFKENTLIGTLAGLGVGGGAAYIYNALKRRSEAKKLKQELTGKLISELDLPMPTPAGASNFLLPLAGPSRLGQSEIGEDIRDGVVNPRGGRHSKNVLQLLARTASSPIPGLSIPIDMAFGVGDNLYAENRNQEARREMYRKARRELMAAGRDLPGR